MSSSAQDPGGTSASATDAADSADAIASRALTSYAHWEQNLQRQATTHVPNTAATHTPGQLPNHIAYMQQEKLGPWSETDEDGNELGEEEKNRKRAAAEQLVGWYERSEDFKIHEVSSAVDGKEKGVSIAEWRRRREVYEMELEEYKAKRREYKAKRREYKAKLAEYKAKYGDVCCGVPYMEEDEDEDEDEDEMSDEWDEEPEDNPRL